MSKPGIEAGRRSRKPSVEAGRRGRASRPGVETERRSRTPRKIGGDPRAIADRLLRREWVFASRFARRRSPSRRSARPDAPASCGSMPVTASRGAVRLLTGRFRSAGGARGLRRAGCTGSFRRTRGGRSARKLGPTRRAGRLADLIGSPARGTGRCRSRGSWSEAHTVVLSRKIIK